MYSESSKAVVCGRRVLAGSTPPPRRQSNTAFTFLVNALDGLIVGGLQGSVIVGLEIHEGSKGQAITFCQVQVRYLIEFPASISTSLEISSRVSGPSPISDVPGGGPILLILPPPGRIVEPRCWASASFSLPGLKQLAVAKESSLFSLIDMLSAYRLNRSIAAPQSVLPAQKQV